MGFGTQRTSLRIFGLFLTVVFFTFLSAGRSEASTTTTAIKDGSTNPCSITDSALIAIGGSGQIVHWDANRSISNNCGNGVSLALGPNDSTVALTLSTSLPSGASNGDVFLAAGNYQIAIKWQNTGEGTYSITYNRQLAVTVSPGSFFFGTVLANASSAAQTFTVKNTGDPGDFDAHIDNIIISGPNAGNFSKVSDGASGTTITKGASRTFSIRCDGNNAAAGTKTATVTVNSSNGTKTAASSATLTCNIQPPVPAISCAPSSNLGTADQTVPGSTVTGAVVLTNSGTAPLVISGMTMSTTAGAGVFTGPTPGSPTTLNPGASVNENIVFHASVAGPAEAVYTGSLSVNNNTTTNPKICAFSARAHHPVPILALDSTLLDYHDVELGFAFTKAIVAHNNGDAPLVVGVHDPSPLPANAAQWNARDISTQTVAPGAHFSFKQTCAPTAVGSYSMTMGVTSNDLTHPTDSVLMTCKGVAPVPIDSVLVLDRSGSMADQIGGAGVHKIDALRQAASLFVDLLNMRAGTSPPPGGDKVAVVKYNDTNSVYVPLGAPFDPTTDPRLQDGAQGDLARLKPDNATGIGGAMQTGAGLIVGSAPDRKHVMVVLTDGIENRTPWIADVMNGPNSIPAKDPLLKIYSLGLGPDNEINAGALQSITNQTNGFHQVANVLDDIHTFDLEAFFFKIFTASTDWQMVVDPTFVADLSSPNPIIIDTARVTTSDKSAVFLALDNPAVRGYYTLELVDPNGNVIIPGSTVGGVPVHVQTHNDYRIVRVIFPDISKSSSYIGDWVLRLTPNGKVPGRPGLSSVGGNAGGAGIHVPIGFAAAVASDFKLAVTATAPSYVPGADITLTAAMTDRGWPAPNGSVLIDIDTPGGAQHYANVVMYDDGTHGDTTAGDAIWTTHFIGTAAAGSYKFFYKASGHNDRGELAPRQDTRYVELTNPVPPGGGPDGGCISCRLQWLLWGLVISLLLLSLLCCLFKGRLPWLR